MAANQLIVGVQNSTDGSVIQARGGKQGESLTSSLHSRYYEQVYRRNVFVGSNGATPSVTTVALATTYTGLALINPIGTNVNLVLLKVGFSFLVVFPAVATIGLMGGYSALGTTTYTAAATNGLSTSLGSGVTAKGQCALSATLVGTPQLIQVLGSGLTGAATTVPHIVDVVDMEGSVIISPGAYVAIYTSLISGAASLAASFMWEEVPVTV